MLAGMEIGDRYSEKKSYLIAKKILYASIWFYFFKTCYRKVLL